MKKESESAKLRAAVQMRIDRYFVSVLDERGGFSVGFFRDCRRYGESILMAMFYIR